MSKNKIKEIIRVNQAGELGAIQIYKGQLAVLKNKQISNDLRDMLKKHKGGFILSYNDCPTIRKYYKGFVLIF